jgi:hypothetical protein
MADFKLGRIKFKWKGNWTSSTAYVKDDIVKFNANSFVCITNHTSSGTTDGWFTNDYANWQLYVPGINNAGTYSSGTKYYLNDIVVSGGSAFISIANANLGNTPISSPSSWSLLVQGAGDMVTNNVYYVSTSTGSNSNDGKQISTAFKTLRYACDNVTGPATIYVKAGVYEEQLPITVPGNVTIIGDGMRNTEIQPLLTKVVTSTYVPTGSTGTTLKVVSNTGIVAGMVVTGTNIGSNRTVQSVSSTDTVILNTAPSGTPAGTITFTQTNLSTDASPVANNLSTMFLLSDATMLDGLLLTGMTGYTPNGASPTDIATATIGGVFCALNPASPVGTKSPYIKDCTAAGTTGIGVLVDGGVHASGNKSMVFHAFTIILDNGVGYWFKDGGKGELVSCFTYYCHIGYATTGGAKIRSLSGNNSYGTYGVISRGFDTTESTVSGTVYGGRMTFAQISSTGTFQIGETITQATSGATGKVTNVQSGVLYYKLTSGTFNTTNLVTGGTSTATMTPTAVGNQTGVIAVVSGLSAVPTSGASIQFAGDSSAYVIKTVSSNAATVNGVPLTFLVLAQDRVNTAADDAAVTIRYNFSQVRLTGHDFLSIGTGGKLTTNYPGLPTQSPTQANETVNVFPGRVYYVTTDQDGNFRVGPYFAVNQATGSATLNASAFDLSGLTSLRLGSIGAQIGAQVDEFSTDGTLSANSDTKVPTQRAVLTYLGASYSSFKPATDIAYDLGSPSKRWRSLYVGPGSITIGSIVLTDNSGNLAVTGSTGQSFSGDTVITGNLTVNGTTTTINSATLAIDDKNIELGSISSVTGLTGTIAGTSTSTTITGIASTVGLLAGQVITRTSGTGAFGGVTTIASVDSLTQISITSTTSNTTGSVVFATGGVTNLTANGAGLTVKGASDKTFNWVNATSAWTSSEHLDLASTKAYYISGTSVLNATTLGSGITGSSLTSVGTLTSLSSGAITTTGTLALNASGGITTDQTTFPLVNATATTVNFAGAATTISIGANTGTTTVNNALTVSGTTSVKQIAETVNTKTSATGSVTHDFTTGAIWYHSSISANFTLALTNVPTNNSSAISVSLILNQGGTGYYPNAVTVNGGAATTIRWANNTTPTPGTNKFDIATFSLIYTGSTWYALGNYGSYA